jgi:hypothetical protein
VAGNPNEERIRSIGYLIKEVVVRQMGTKLSHFAQRFMKKFQQGDVKAFIIVTDLGNGRHPIITLIHRARFGSKILPIPAWLNQSEAEQFLHSHSDVLKNDKVIEVTHDHLQKMIEEHEYDAFYPQAVSYHLDIQVDDSELADDLISE